MPKEAHYAKDPYNVPVKDLIQEIVLLLDKGLLQVIFICTRLTKKLNLHIIIYLNVRNMLVNEIVFSEIYFSYWTFDLRKIY
jgi:hypothetical protein